jgi:prepilin-type N-terminal cleavage/methylation domain-containing protein
MLERGNEEGFTLIEIAIVMVIIGLLAGGGVSLMGMLSERKARNETSSYLEEAKTSLISFARINGRLPWADGNGDGNEDVGTSVGWFPYKTLRYRPTDSNKRVIRYEINSNLGSDRPSSCSALRGGLSGSPLVVDSDGSSTAFPIAAILVSAGPKDADGDGNVFDDVTTGAHQGDNRDGNPNYIRHPPDDVFDDLVVYVSEYSLYGEICGDPVIAVSNGTGSNIFIYDSTRGSDIGIVTPGDTISYRIIAGTRIELRDAAGGGGGIVTSSPTTPLVVAGSGTAINAL